MQRIAIFFMAACVFAAEYAFASWVTRVDANPLRHPHHRPSAGAALPVPRPGLMAADPHRARQILAMRKLPNLQPAKMHLDEPASYVANELAIDWQAPLVLVLAGMPGEK